MKFDTCLVNAYPFRGTARSGADVVQLENRWHYATRRAITPERCIDVRFGSNTVVVLDGMARPEGFEPSCDRLEDGCLNPLGYGRVNLVVPTSGIEPMASSLPWTRSAN